jgi:hypothetical protein
MKNNEEIIANSNRGLRFIFIITYSVSLNENTPDRELNNRRYTKKTILAGILISDEIMTAGVNKFS